MSSQLFRVTADDMDMTSLVEAWMPDQKQLLNAVRTATRKTLRWARTIAVREIRAETGLPAAILRDRISIHLTNSNGKLSARMFFGLRPIPASQLRPRQGKAGVQTNGAGLIRGAFLVDMGSHDGVFKRVGKERYPLAYQRIHIHKQAERVIKGEILPNWQGVFLKVLEQELKWRTR